jgi:DNA-binding SARP family transcriptional activator/tetratricopeptide (TPR) repeat protein
MQVRLLGPVELAVGTVSIPVGGPRAQAVLAVLAARAGEVATADWLIDQLWGERPPRTARVSLQTYVSRLRRAYPPETESLLPRHPRGYLLDDAAAAIDTRQFGHCSTQARLEASEQRWPDAVHSVREAARLWHGDPFTGIEGVPVLHVERHRLAELRAENRFIELHALLETADPADVIGPLRELAEDRRWDERAWRLLMLALYRAGRQTEALHTAAQARRMLVDEQGLDPSPALAELERHILLHDRSLVQSPQPPSPQPPSPQSPPCRAAPARPASWLATPATPLIGRTVPLTELLHRWERVVHDRHAELVLVEGEPGVGKSHLVATLADEVASLGGAVLAGRCLDEPRLPLQPWSDLLPDTAGQWPEQAAGHREGHPMIDVWELAAHRLFTDITQRFHASLDSAATLMIAEDIHWAGVAALRLLQHLIASCARCPLLVVATVRSSGAGVSVATQGALGELTARLQPATVRLTGLSPTDLQTMLAGRGRQVSLAEAVAIHRRTEGVPLLAMEAMNGGHGILAARLGRVSDTAVGLAELLAVAGDLYPLAVLNTASGLDEDGLASALDELTASGLVRPAASAVISYEFRHALYRESLDERLSDLRRVALSRRLLAASDALPGQVRPTTLARYAVVMSSSGQPADISRAGDECRRAGDWSTANHEHHEAAGWLRDAIELALRVRSPAREVAELQLAHGLACRRAGLPQARDAFLRAAALARDVADRSLLARTGIGWSRGFFSQIGAVDTEFVAVLREALQPGSGSTPLPQALRARAMAALAAELTWATEGNERFAMADEALELARSAGDRTALAEVLTARHLTVAAADTLAVSRRDTTELLELSGELGDVGLRFQALFHRTGPAIDDGDVGLIERLLGEAGEIADLVRQPALQWHVDWSRASLLLWQGMLASAEKLARESAELGIAAGQQGEATAFLGAQLLEIRRLQGRLGELAPMLAVVPPDAPDAFSVARYLCAAGHPDAARARLDRVRPDGPELRLRRDPLQRPSLDNLAWLAARLDRRDLAAAVHARMEPLADTFGHAVVANPVGYHWLGVLALALGRPDEAAAHLSRAVTRHAALDLPLLEAESLLELARAYEQRPDPDRADEARSRAHALATGQGAFGLISEPHRDGRHT